MQNDEDEHHVRNDLVPAGVDDGGFKLPIPPSIWDRLTMHTRSADPAEMLRAAASVLSRGADRERYGGGEPIDYSSVDAALAQVLGVMLARYRPNMIKALAQRCARAQGSLSRLMSGETVTDPMTLASEIAALRQAVLLLKAEADRETAIARGAERPSEAAHPVQ
jgi:hypothetical protein